MFRRPHYFAVAVVALLALVLLNLPERAAARLKIAIGSLFLPLFGLAGGAQQAATAAADALTPRRELLKQNEALRREIQQLRIQALQAEESLRGQERVREQLGRPRPPQWKLKLAHVVSRDPANWWRAIQVDLGSRDGVRTDMAVLTSDGLVGKVGTVSLMHSQVIMLGDPNCRVSVVVENAARDQGIIGVAGGPFDGSLVELDYLARTATIKPGQRVLTSGDGGVFPKGIPVGTIADSRLAGDGMFSEAHVKLAANLGALEEVWVLFP